MLENKELLFHFDEIKKVYEKFVSDFANYSHLYEYSMIIDALKYYDTELLALGKIRGEKELHENIVIPSQILTYCYTAQQSMSEARLENLFHGLCKHIGMDKLPKEYSENKKEYDEIFEKELAAAKKEAAKQREEYEKMMKLQQEAMEKAEANLLDEQKSKEELDESKAIEI